MKFRNFSRGQLFTADLLVAVAVIILVLGVSLHVSEAIQRGVAKQSDLSASSSEEVSEAVVLARPFNLSYSKYCLAYSNGTSNCSSISCPSGDVLGTRRLVNCTSSTDNTCVLSVRACVSRD